MRFVLAIVAFVVAAAMIVLGIAQRTVFLGPSTYALETSVGGDLPYTVISGKVLVSQPGQQSITVSGSDTVFVAYGRTDDVKAWLGTDSYNSITIDKTSGELVSSVVKPESGAEEDPEVEPSEPPSEEEVAALANPAGSDLWLAEYSEEAAVLATVNVPDDVSVIIASDGVEAAPSKVQLSWPLNNATPWAGPLIVAGIILLLVGLALYLLGIHHMRKSRGPRRKSISAGPGMEKMPKVPKPSRYKSDKQHGSAPKRRRAMIAVIPVALVSSLALSGCSAGFWPDFSQQSSATPTPTATALPDADTEELPAPAVTAPQFERIIAKVSSVAVEADKSLDTDLAATRLDGPALDERTSNYKIRTSLADFAPVAAIPASPVSLTLPQATDLWPRTVMGVIRDETDASVAPTGVVMVQENPRAPYKITYTVRFEADAEITGVAPATIGAAQLPPESNFTLLQPDQVAAAYADVIQNGENSESYALFDAESDTLRAAIKTDREAKDANLPDTASIEFATAAGDGQPIALATNESGAIVAVNITETETVKPKEAGAKIKLTGAVAALSGVTESEKGVESTYGDQLLFYVPPAGSSDKIQLLGFSQGLLSAVQLP